MPAIQLVPPLAPPQRGPLTLLGLYRTMGYSTKMGGSIKRKGRKPLKILFNLTLGSPDGSSKSQLMIVRNRNWLEGAVIA